MGFFVAVVLLSLVETTFAVDEGSEGQVVSVPLKFGYDEFTQIEMELGGNVYEVNVPSFEKSADGTVLGVMTVYDIPAYSSVAKAYGNHDASSPARLAGRAIGFEIRSGREQVDAVFHLEPLIITFSGLQNPDEDEPVCLHRSSRNDSFLLTESCFVSSVYLDKVACSCDHAAHFAIGFQPRVREPDAPSGSNYPPGLQAEQDPLTSTKRWHSSIVVSIVFFFVFLQAKMLYGLISARTSSHINITLSLLALHVSFHFFVNVEDQIAGAPFAVLVHYFLQATFTWLLLEGVLIYMRSQDDPAGLKDIHISACMLIGWGCPAVFVLISLAYDCHGFAGAGSSWPILDDSFVWSFYSPFTYIAVMKASLLIQYFGITPTTPKMHSGFRLVIVMESPLIVAWCVCLYCRSPPFVILSHSLVSLNSLQGMLVFFPKCLNVDQ